MGNLPSALMDRFKAGYVVWFGLTNLNCAKLVLVWR